MLVSLQTNNYQQPFGHFRFSSGAQELINKKINSSAKLKKFKELCELEETGDRARRNTDIAWLWHITDRLYTTIGNKEYMQGIFQSTNSFLKQVIKKADKYEKLQKTPGYIDIESELGKIFKSEK